MQKIPMTLHPVAGLTVGTAGNAASTMDWVNCENAHRLYCIAMVKRAVASVDYMQAYSASNSAGTGSSEITSGLYFYSQTATYDRLVYKSSSNSSTVTASATGPLMLVGVLDCAALPSSHSWAAFALRNSSQAGNLRAAVYLLENRYGGYQQFLATTSST